MPFVPQRFTLEKSASEFILRVDSVEEITSEHYYWYLHHPEDKHASIEELRSEIESAYYQSPIQLNSKSGTIRELAQQYDFFRKRAKAERNQVWKTGFDLSRFLVYILSRWRIISQLFRVPILIGTFALTIAFYRSSTNTLQSFTSHHLVLSILILSVLAQLYTLLFDDHIFSRAWCQYSSKTKEGLYVHPTDVQSLELITKMPILKEPEQYPFGWCNGDIQTLIPGLLWEDINLELPYIRRYIKNLTDSEAFAADICFPTRSGTGDLYFDNTKSIIILHHGLNGSSMASYIQAHVAYYTKRGHTCICLNARGFGGSFILRKMFIGSRVSDLHYLTMVAHIGAGNNTHDDLITFTRKKQHTLKSDEPQLMNFATVFKDGITPMNTVENSHVVTTPVCGLGFSMGGIIISNYCVYYGKMTGLQSVFAVCALADRNGNTKRSQSERDWEIALSDTLKTFLSRAEPILYSPQKDHLFGDGVERYINLSDLTAATSIKHFDSIFTCITHGLPTLEHYYHDLSFMQSLKLENLQTKLFILHPANDPVVDIDNMYPATQVLCPEHEQDAEFVANRWKYYRKHDNIKNLILWIPRTGGHVASFRKYNDQWEYLCEISYQFHKAVDQQLKSIPVQEKKSLPAEANTSPHRAHETMFHPSYRNHTLETLASLRLGDNKLETNGKSLPK